MIIPIPTVSGAHAKVELGKPQHQNESLLRFFLTLFRFLLVAEGEALYITDLESTNGTFVNNERIEAGAKTAVTAGSSVIFGDANLANYLVEQAGEGSQA